MGRKESTVRLFTRDGVPIRVCSRLATAVDTSGEATKGFDPIYRVGRKIDMYKKDFKEALCLFKGKEARLPVIQVIETKNVGVSSPGNLASFLRLAAEADALKNRVSNEKARHHTSALLRNFKLDDKGPLDKLEVFKFVRSWVRAFVPPNLLGSKNTKFFLDNLKFVLGAGKGSAVRLWQVMRRMSVDTVLWLNSSEVAAEKVPLVMKQQALAKVVVWLLQNVVWRVITSYFHLTDMSGTRHKLQFYRKKHFHALFNRNLRAFVSDDLLKPLSTNKAMDVLSIPDCPGEAKGRLFPKASGGCRLLAAKKNAHANEDDSRLLLALLKDRHPEVVDSRGRGLHRGWSKFAKKAKEKGAKIFFVRVDIKNAFDTIKLSKLSEILVNLAKNEMRETAYVHTVRYLDQHGRVFRSRRLSSKRKREYPVPDGCRLLPVASRPIEARRLLKWVERRGRLHTIAISVGRSRGPLRFLKQKGLIQGDTLSSALCDLYYGEMVKSQLEPAMRREVGAGERRLFVRGVDDFAFFSTSRREAERFLRLMEKGFPEYDCFIRPEKTVTNLGGSGASEFSFCGTLIDAENLQTRPDFSSYHGRSVVDSLKFNLRKGTTEERYEKRKGLHNQQIFKFTLSFPVCYNRRCCSSAPRGSTPCIWTGTSTLRPASGRTCSRPSAWRRSDSTP